ncbi:hypothetical protein FISHEDRAFT_60346 [Fistulina hepatica ATCC 64428]|uniref:Uncharacterized protein n=1 Tax=Fistulina hepatica ATCC 64428 TaxID=1128425 RepID=A0A0D7A7V9_9AGAR|nr:hypothetical protein FISHEDRAFT_60346 [Fistulina hepatica ATCC 64428]
MSYGILAAFNIPGIFTNAILYGIVLLQAYLYYNEFTWDPTWIKIYVTTLVIADTFNTVFAFRWIYTILMLASDPAMVSILAILVQGFFAYRVYVLGRRQKILPAFILFCSFVGASGGIVFTIAFHYYTDLESLATVPSARALSMVWLIPGHANRPFFLTSSLAATVANGLITSVIAIVDLICFLAMPLSNAKAVFRDSPLKRSIILPGLNARSSLRGRAEKESHSLPLSGGDMPTSGTGNGVGTRDIVNIPLNSFMQGNQQEQDQNFKVHINVETSREDK